MIQDTHADLLSMIFIAQSLLTAPILTLQMSNYLCIWVYMLNMNEIEIENRHKITFYSSIESNAAITAELPLLALRSI